MKAKIDLNTIPYHKKFALKEHCSFVKGAKRGCIYNLNSGDIYSIDSEACALLELCESELVLDDILENAFFKEKTNEVIQYLIDLETNNLGCFIENNQRIRKLKIDEPPEKLDFLWLELTQDCNLRCIHCYNPMSTHLHSKRKISTIKWKRILLDAFELGCRKIQFIGGEPFLSGSLMNLLKYAKSIGYNFVEIFTNSTLIKHEHYKLFLDLDINIATSLYGPSGKVHDQITLKSGSFEKAITNIRRLHEKGIKVRIGTIIMRGNEAFLKDTVDFIKNVIGVKDVRYDFVRPSGRGNNEALIPEQSISKSRIDKPLFNKVHKHKYLLAKFGHNCFYRMACITSEGDVVPCVMVRNIKLGNVEKRSLKEIYFDKTSREIRCLSKEKIDTCKDCEYRYACFDCRVIAKGWSNCSDLHVKNSSCLYNPYSGEWGKNI
ncbi:MAG: radical SAM protein [Marinilabiliaceae bacterium]|nr:radical SAM protein [Marinilabiliaceae bacterium]